MNKKEINNKLNSIMEGSWKSLVRKIGDSKAMQFVGSIGAAGMGMSPSQIKAKRKEVLAKRKQADNKNKVADTTKNKNKGKV